MQYFDEALKLDVRSLMAVAMRTGKQSAYSITLSFPTGQVICRDLRSSSDRVVSASITVNWPTKTGDPVSGGIFLTFRGWDDRATEQTVYLRGTPAKVGSWLWRATCPETRQPVQALYLAPDGDRFLSRDATGLKYRRANTRAARYARRCFKLAQKLKTDHFGPGIGKPRGMSDRTFDKLEWQLKKEHIRYLCAILKKPDPEFHDEDPVAPKRPNLSALRRAPRVNCSNYSRDKSGAIKLGVRLETKFGTWARDRK